MQSNYSLEQIAKIVNGQIRGESQADFIGIAPLEKASKNQISFIANKKYARYLETTQAGAVLINKTLAEKFSGVAIIVEDAYLAYAKLSHYFDLAFKPAPGIDESANIHPSVDIGTNVYIGANVVIEQGATIGDNCKIYPQTYIGANAVIGENTTLYAQVVLYHDVEVGKNCIIHSHAVLGADGFGFAPSSKGFVKIAQIGRVIIEDYVEVGAGTTIDRGALEDTHIGLDSKLDNLVQIGHGASIGSHTAIAGCVGIAGSTKIGNGCLIGGGSGIAGHIEIADGVQIAGMSGVAHSIEKPGGYASAITAFDIGEWAKASLRFRELDSMYKRIKVLEKQLVKLENEQEQ